MSAESETYAFGPYVLDRPRRALLRGGETISVTPKAFDLLTVLAENGGKVVSKETLMTRLWPDTAVEEGSLAFQVSTLRKALGDGRYIVTIPGRGYQLAGPVQLVEEREVEAILRDEERTTITVSDDRKLVPLVAFGIAAAIAVVAVFWLVVRKRPAATNSIHSIAVLPFRPIAGDHRDEALELGMADTLITRLSHLSNVTVIPTSAVRRFDKLDQDPLAIARELGVDSVLDGSLQRSTDRIRVTVHLLRTSDGRLLWTEQFDEKSMDLFAVEDRVADGVARSIAPALSGREHQLLVKRSTADPEAYALYQKGVYWKERDARRALEFFHRALARDPNFAAAWAGIASASLFSVRFSIRPQPPVFEEARHAAEKAIALDPEMADAYASLASLHSDYDWQFDRADHEFRHALELDPSSIEAQTGYAYLHGFRRDFGVAIEHSRRAQELDPVSPLAAVDAAICLGWGGRTEEAIRSLQETLRLYPELIPAKLHLGLDLTYAGRAGQAVEVLREALLHKPKSTALRSTLGYALARAGNHDEALRIATELETHADIEPVGPLNMALLWMVLGDFDHAFVWLNRGCDERIPLVRIVNAEPAMEPLRRDARYPALLKRIGL